MERKDNCFTNFADLPSELRCMIWKEAMPAYSTYPVNLEHVLVDSTDDQNSSRIRRLSLRPRTRKGENLDFFKERVRTQRILLETCKESRGEVYRHFPDTIDGAGPPSSHRHDLIYIKAKLFTDLFFRDARLEFQGDWNKLIHQLALDIDTFEFWFSFLPQPGNAPPQWFDRTPIDRLMGFLTAFTNLKQVVFTEPDEVRFGTNARAIMCPEDPDPEDPDMLSKILPGCYKRICINYVTLEIVIFRLEGVRSVLEELIFYGPKPALHGDRKGAVKSGYPMLRNLEISNMVQIGELHGKCCRQTRSRTIWLQFILRLLGLSV